MKTIELTTDLERAYFEYAVETIVDRALPRVEDGLKPVQRRILYAMHDMGLIWNKPYRKSARVVGEVLGKYHPHGDASVYGALVRMAQDFSLREPLVDGQGNFGSVDGDMAAAMRYTETRLSPIAELLTQDINRDTVNWVDNFDGSLQEPVILPTVLPNLLINGSAGVAVGMATNIPPHNVGEVAAALIYVARHWQQHDSLTVDDLLRFIPGPDFPTGGLVYRYRVEPGGNGSDNSVIDTIRAAYETGRGRIVTQARVNIEQTKGGKADIIVSEIPYTVQKSTVLEKIAKEVRDGRISGVTDLRDESDYTGMRVVIEVARGNDPRQVLESLLAYTQLRQTFGVTSLALVDDGEGEAAPKLLSLRDMLVHFVGHRLKVIERRSRHELAEREARLHVVKGLVKAIEAIDQVIALIRKAKDVDTARQGLIKQFDFSEAQAKAILAMQLSRLAALERTKLKEEGRELWERIKVLKELLASEAKQLDVVIEETTLLKNKFATARRTVIIEREDQAAGLGARTEAELATVDKPQVVAMTNRGVLRVAAEQFGYRVKEGLSARAVEAHLRQFYLQPQDTLLLVSNQGRVWKAPVGRVPSEASFADLGLTKGEYLLGGGVLAPGHYLTIGTRTGQIKRVKVEDLSMNEISWVSMIGLSNKDEVLFAAVASNQAEVMFFTTGGKAIRFAANEVNPQATPSARGVTGIRLGKEDSLTAGTVIESAEKMQVIVVSQTGFVKRTPLAEFPLQGRGGQGVQSLEITKVTGKVATATVTTNQAKTCDALSAKGLRHRLMMDNVPETDRRKRGEKLADFGDDDAIVAIVILRGV